MDSILEFFKNTTIKELIFLFVGALLGYLSNLIFYLKSKNASNEKNLDRLFKLHEQSTKKPDFDLITKEIKEIIGTDNSLKQLTEELNNLKEKIDKTQKKEDVIRYRVLGDEWSDKYLQTIQPRILTNDGLLFYSSIMAFHKSIFPPDFPWAGKVRDNNVVISSTFGTMMDMESLAEVEYNMKPVPYQDVTIEMEKFCNKWNITHKGLLTKSYEMKIDSIAKFHHEFQIIHPFLDGNGRVGRVLLEDMAEYLLNRKLSAVYEREDYYNALRLADMGKISHLKDFILKQINK